MLQDKIRAHEAFWRGEGPCLLFIPTAAMELYDTEGYCERFHQPSLMWEAEMRRARPVVDWPTDGIPTVRPNLGVVFVPAIAGADFEVRDGAMPWPGKPLSREQIREVTSKDVAAARLMQRAEAFYSLHAASGETEVTTYPPDTQGVFDIAHLLDGEHIFLETCEDPEWISELMEVCLRLYVKVSKHLKECMQQPGGSMVHGHGTTQGAWFPHAGVRISEDTPTLLSPSMIESLVIPYIERAAAPFEACFVHYCGLHESFFEQLCRSAAVRAIDLGNSEMYDLHWLLERCAESGTVLYSRVSAQAGEDWQTYTKRVSRAVRDTGARVILRPMAFPETREECGAMLDLWHELTA